MRLREWRCAQHATVAINARHTGCVPQPPTSNSNIMASLTSKHQTKRGWSSSETAFLSASRAEISATSNSLQNTASLSELRAIDRAIAWTRSPEYPSCLLSIRLISDRPVNRRISAFQARMKALLRDRRSLRLADAGTVWSGFAMPLSIEEAAPSCFAPPTLHRATKDYLRLGLVCLSFAFSLSSCPIRF